ncbi:hypothetical protein [Proteus terrae]|uniref:hypothetical protein n=1 Tax=Proteus terrae TaxID=1574161 RepID=UPI00301D6787
MMSELKKCPECKSTKVGVAKKLKFPMWFEFVDKANTAGMGNPMLMKFDSLLSGVRV